MSEAENGSGRKFRLYPTTTDWDTVLVVTVGVLLTCFVVFTVGTILGTPAAGLLGVVVWLVVVEWKISDSFELRSRDTDADPVLVIEPRGILIDENVVENDLSEDVVTIPWSDVRGVYFDTQRRRGIAVQEWLAIEVEDFDGSPGLLEEIGMQFALGDSSRAEAYLVNADAFHAEFDEIRAAIDRYSDATVEDSDHSIDFDPV